MLAACLTFLTLTFLLSMAFMGTERVNADSANQPVPPATPACSAPEFHQEERVEADDAALILSLSATKNVGNIRRRRATKMAAFRPPFGTFFAMFYSTLATAIRPRCRQALSPSYAKFFAANSQFTRFQKASIYFGRAFR